MNGPSDAFVTWTVTGANETTVGDITFSDFEHLVGAAGSNDVFVVQKDGSIGSVAGGAGGHDGLVIYESDTTGVFVNPGATAPAPCRRPASPSCTRGSTTRTWSTASAPRTPARSPGRSWTTRSRSAPARAPGTMKAHFDGTGWSGRATGTTTHDFTFNDPITALRDRGKGGHRHDHRRVARRRLASGAELDIFGSAVKTSGPPVIVDQPYVDTVTFSGSVNTNGGAVNVYAQKINVAANVTLTTSDLTFRARLVGIATLENLSPVFGTDRRGRDRHRRGGDDQRRRRHLPDRGGRRPEPRRHGRRAEGGRQLLHRPARGQGGGLHGAAGEGRSSRRRPRRSRSTTACI